MYCNPSIKNEKGSTNAIHLLTDTFINLAKTQFDTTANESNTYV